jgi:hypothetical protein
VGHTKERWLRMITALAARQGPAPTPAGLCTACAEVLGAGGVGLVLMDHTGLPVATYASDLLTAELEELQFSLGVGPGPDAYRQGVPVIESDLVGHPPGPWIGFTAAALEKGTRAVFAFPLRIGAARLGALTLYVDQPGRPSGDAYADSLVMADVVTMTLLAAQSGTPDWALADQVSDDGAYRAVVHQASGMISVQLDIDVGEALARLRARAATQNLTVADLAALVISRELRLEK